MVERNFGNQARHETKDRYLDECFSKCPDCRKQDLIEVAKPEENKLFVFCLSCGFKKFKGEIMRE